MAGAVELRPVVMMIWQWSAAVVDDNLVFIKSQNISCWMESCTLDKEVPSSFLQQVHWWCSVVPNTQILIGLTICCPGFCPYTMMSKHTGTTVSPVWCDGSRALSFIERPLLVRVTAPALWRRDQISPTISVDVIIACPLYTAVNRQRWDFLIARSWHALPRCVTSAPSLSLFCSRLKSEDPSLHVFISSTLVALCEVTLSLLKLNHSCYSLIFIS